jgi:hypothetical protein
MTDEFAPWETLPGDLVRVVLLQLVNEEVRQERVRFRDFVALKNTCRAFLHAAERLAETEAVKDAMRHHELYKKHLVLKEKTTQDELRAAWREAERRDCHMCCLNACYFALGLIVAIFCPCVLCCTTGRNRGACGSCALCMECLSCCP